MRRLWLLLAQTVTVALGLYVVLQALHPGWLDRSAPRMVPAGPSSPAQVLPPAATAKLPRARCRRWSTS
jgi:serine protease DegQ